MRARRGAGHGRRRGVRSWGRLLSARRYSGARRPARRERPVLSAAPASAAAVASAGVLVGELAGPAAEGAGEGGGVGEADAGGDGRDAVGALVEEGDGALTADVVEELAVAGAVIAQAAPQGALAHAEAHGGGAQVGGLVEVG